MAFNGTTRLLQAFVFFVECNNIGAEYELIPPSYTLSVSDLSCDR